MLKSMTNHRFYSCTNGDMSANHAIDNKYMTPAHTTDASVNGSTTDARTNTSTTARQMPTRMPAQQQDVCLLKRPHDSKMGAHMTARHTPVRTPARQTPTQTPAWRMPMRTPARWTPAEWVRTDASASTITNARTDASMGPTQHGHQSQCQLPCE